jgi:hypothetical protein
MLDWDYRKSLSEILKLPAIGIGYPVISESDMKEIDERIQKIVNRLRDEEVKPDIVIGE